MTCPSETLQLGERVWTRELLDVFTSRGTANEERFGAYVVQHRLAIGPLQVRRASRPYRCQRRGCRSAIGKGELHASAFYRHYCLECVMRDERRPEYRFTDAEEWRVWNGQAASSA